MKRFKYFYLLPVCFMAIALVQACKKSWLDVAPQGALNDLVLANKTGVGGLLIGAYAKLGGSQNWGSAPSNWVFGSVAADEAYKGSTSSDQIGRASSRERHKVTKGITGGRIRKKEKKTRDEKRHSM